jgi:glycosyltransferase involved in cell wall biosynthesis
VAPENVDDLVAVLDYYYRNRDVAAREGENGRRYLEARFTLDRACSEYHALLKEMHANPVGAV